MPRYHIKVTAMSVEHQFREVEAKSPEEAIKKVMEADSPDSYQKHEWHGSVEDETVTACVVAEDV